MLQSSPSYISTDVLATSLVLNNVFLEAVIEGVSKTRCSYKFRKIHTKGLVPESLFLIVEAATAGILFKKSFLVDGG